MDPVSSRVLMAASSGETPEFWGPAYIRGAITKITKVQTTDQPETLVAVGSSGLLAQRDINGNWQSVVLANKGPDTGIGDFTDIVSNGTTIATSAANAGSLSLMAALTLDGLSNYSSFSFDNINATGIAWSPELELYVAISLSGIYLSENGFSWSGPQYQSPGGNCIVWSGTAFLASTGQYVYKSLDGVTWDLVADPGAGFVFALKRFPLSPSGNVVVALGGSGGSFGTGLFSYTTNDGAGSWTQIYSFALAGGLVDIAGPGPFNLSFPSISDLRVLSQSGKLYNMAGTEVADTLCPSARTLYWDSDIGYLAGGGLYDGSGFLTASEVDTGPWGQVSMAPEYTLKALVWDGSRFVAIGYGGAVYESTDGLSWNKVYTIEVNEGTGAQDAIEDLVWTGSFFTGVGAKDNYYGRIVYSTDGLTWTSLSDGVGGTEKYRAVAWSGSLLCAVGESTRIATSSDGLSWSFQTPPSGNTSRDLNGIAWGNSTWVAVGESGKVIAATPSGVTWTDYSISTSTSLASVAYGNGLFVAVGETSIYTSPTGNGWTLRTQPLSSFSLTSVTWTGDRFIAVASGGQVIASEDGITWTTLLERQSAEEAEAKIVKRRPLYKVRSGGRYVVAVGDSGAVTLTPRPSTPPFPMA